jgi:RNA polymerase sigma-70 factor (sigma-E family)
VDEQNLSAFGSGELVDELAEAVVQHTGTERGFGQVVAEHHHGLAQLAYVMCGDRQQAEDAVAEAYARVWPRFRRGKVDDLLPYLRRAVVNEIRGGWRRKLLERREETRRQVDWRAGLSPESEIDDNALLWPALLQLPATQRAVVVLRFLEDLSEEQTADMLGLKVGTVKSRAGRGLEQLRRLLGDTGV